MLKPRDRDPSENDLHSWIAMITSNCNIPMRRINKNQWQLTMRHSIIEYYLDIVDQGQWISYGALLVRDVVGPEPALITFYDNLFQLSTRLNGVHIGKQGNLWVLTREEYKAGLTPLFFGNSIVLINSVHQYVYGEVLELIKKLGLKIRRPQ